MSRRVLVFGPAYLDRVLRVDRPLLPDGLGGPLDLSVGVTGEEVAPGESALRLIDPEGGTIEVEPPDDWPMAPGTTIHLDRPLSPGAGPWRHRVLGETWLDDLGGMGAGFASALGGALVTPLGPPDDPMSRRIAELLRAQGIPCRCLDRPRERTDWTLLLTSGPHGDKLPVGFRSGLPRPGEALPEAEPVDLLVAASLTNRHAASAFDGVRSRVRMFAPTLRNMTDPACPVLRLAPRIDLLCCNRREWEALPDREAVADRIPIVSITDGPAGGVVRFRDPGGVSRELSEPAFPRRRPPRDTNRAGECFASALITALLDAGWTPGPVDAEVIRASCRRASAAAALVLDRDRFGFPAKAEVEEALRAGEIP
ncbi:PfkB family carbohydrate kinase [Tautonia sociabilis]|uniref:Sugar kinase n=1 Tax=Tautonia sociabilis TaxID=2080755 RepID=A0A432MFR8_9BACT|nr:PfkB family carbohydrate kinase [Tautonia sociabilis]RUL85067.1 sugar kinase [Tautonia sociabilis]